MERITVARRLRNPRSVSHSIMFLAIRNDGRQDYRKSDIANQADPIMKGDQ